MSITGTEKEYPATIYEQKCRIVRFEAALQAIVKKCDLKKIPDYMATVYLKQMKEIAEEALKWE